MFRVSLQFIAASPHLAFKLANDCIVLLLLFSPIFFREILWTQRRWVISFLSSRRRQFPSTPTVPKIPSWQIPLKPPSASGSQSVNHSSSDISPVSVESTNSSPVKDACHSPHEALGGPDGARGVNGDSATVDLEGTLPLDLKDQVRMEVQGEEEKKEEDDVSHIDEEEEEEEDGVSMQTEDRRGGDGQINEQVDKLRRPEGASNESEVD